jgi:DNA-binding response OmpR family regulator
VAAGLAAATVAVVSAQPERPVVLFVEDERSILEPFSRALAREGFEPVPARTVAEALAAARERPPDVVLLDVMLPDGDGRDVLRELRKSSDVPVIMLTARSQELEKVRGLTAGADDYVAKPFGRQELLARVQALLRRSGGRTDVTETYEDDFVRIDYAQRRVGVDDREVSLTPLEFKLLSAFVQHPEQVLSRDQLLDLVWGDPYGVSVDQVKLYVGYLRKKLCPDAPDSAPIETVRGFGYRYRKP